MISKIVHEDSIHTLHLKTKLLSKEHLEYIKFFLSFVKQNEIRLRIADEETVNVGGIAASGLFDFARRELHLAVNKPTNVWFETLMHERCHAEQLTSGTFTAKHDGDITKLFSWVDGKIELSQDEVNSLVETACELESDCEIRVVKDIERFDLSSSINPGMYSQKANAYVTFYKHIGKHRTWYIKDRQPYALERIWSNFPNTIIPGGCALTPELENLLNLCITLESNS